jgi:GNAT superfamily N-acetyltransferase
MPFQLTFSGYPAPDGPLRVADVPWDSDLFGFPVFEVRIFNDTAALDDALRDWTAALPARCLAFTKVPLSDVGMHRKRVAHGFYPVETQLELHLPLGRFAPVVARAPRGWRLRRAELADVPRLAELAAESFQADRYHRDPALDAAAADRRYACWIEDGFRRGEPTYVYENADTLDLAGFYHLRPVGDTTIDLSLAALSPMHQRIGLGVLLYQDVLLEAQKAGYAVATTRISVDNTDVLNLFARLGFVFHHPVLTFHRTAVSTIDERGPGRAPYRGNVIYTTAPTV